MYQKTSVFYIKNSTDKIGAVAVGLTHDNRVKITASARSKDDKHIPGKDRSIALSRLNNAFYKTGRKNQTRYIDIPLEQAKKLKFEDLVKDLYLYHNSNITNWVWNETVKGQPRSGRWTKYLINTKEITKILREQIEWLTREQPSRPKDETLDVLYAEKEKIEKEIAEKKKQLKSMQTKKIEKNPSIFNFLVDLLAIGK